MVCKRLDALGNQTRAQDKGTEDGTGDGSLSRFWDEEPSPVPRPVPREVVYSGLTRGEARVVEQVLISAYILDNLYNARREIAVSNIGNYRQSLNSAMRLFGSLSEESLYY